MATLASLVVNLRTNSAEFSRGMQDARRNTLRLHTSAGNLKRQFVGLRTALVATGAAAAGALIAARKFVDAAATQEDAVENLRASLLATGRDGTQSLELLTRRAADLQRITTKGDEATIAATASLAQLARELTAPDLARAQEAIIGLADTHFGGNLQSAAAILGKTLGSTTNALTRYGITVDTSASQSEKLRQILDQTNAMFEVSQARATTLKGRQEQLSNAFGDLREELGFVVADILELTDRSRGLTESVERLTAAIHENRRGWVGATRSILGLVRIVGNAALIAVNVVVVAISAIVGNVVNLLNILPDLLNRFIEQANRIPGVDIDFRVDLIPVERLFKVADAAAGQVLKDIGDIGRIIANSARGSAEIIVTAARTASDVLDQTKPPTPPAKPATVVSEALAPLPTPVVGLVQSIQDAKREFRGLNRFFDEATNRLGELDRAVIGVATSFSNTLSNAITHGRLEFGEFVKSAIADLAALAAKFAIFKALSFLFPQSGLVAGIGQAFGFKAHGGPVQSGRAFVVGEQGPELFVPRQSGTIIPNGGAPVVVNLPPLPPARNALESARDADAMRWVAEVLRNLEDAGAIRLAEAS